MKILTLSDKIILFPLWALSLLPLRVLYLLSDFLYVIVYYVARYRYKVVYTNLRNSFPEKEEKEIVRIAKDFYHYLCDLIIEIIYLINMRESEFRKRFKSKNFEVPLQLFEEGRNIAAATGHFGNWEWVSNFRFSYEHKMMGIYKPLSNKRIDRLFIYIRSRHGSIPIPMKQTLRTISECVREKGKFVLYFVSDQRPMKSEINLWVDFLNQKTPVITGMDKLVRKYNMAFLFMGITRVRRGYYEAFYELIDPNPESAGPNELVEKYMMHLETLIRRQPELYLWSHKRWKYSYDDFKGQEVNS